MQMMRKCYERLRRAIGQEKPGKTKNTSAGRPNPHQMQQCLVFWKEHDLN